MKPAVSGILDIVSDDYIRLIPADKNWQPTPEAAASAEAYVASLCSGPDDDVWEVSSEFYDQVALIDAGGLTTQVTCPLCGGDVTGWGFGLLAEHRENIGTRDVTIPCCGVTVPPDTLRYDAPVGFARFQVRAMNPFGPDDGSLTPGNSPAWPISSATPSPRSSRATELSGAAGHESGLILRDRGNLHSPADPCAVQMSCERQFLDLLHISWRRNVAHYLPDHACLGFRHATTQSRRSCTPLPYPP